MTKEFRVGTITYATCQGLGILAKSFRDHGIITDALLLEHRRRENHPEWHPGSTMMKRVDRGIIRQFIGGELTRDGARGSAPHASRSKLDAMLFLETPFDWNAVTYCRAKEVKSFLMVMHECMWSSLPAIPDVLLCPSDLDLEWAKEHHPQVEAIRINVPVDVKWRRRGKVETFIHNAGWGGLKGRNGTEDLLAALKYVQKPIRLILRSQEPVAGFGNNSLVFDGISPSCGHPIGNVTLDYRVGTFSPGELWDEGEAFIFPERFNGLSLPLQEACASGMLVIAGDRFPMNRWLPRSPLINVKEFVEESITPGFTVFESARYDPREIARCLDEWHGMDISDFSDLGGFWAEENSWERLGPKWMEVLKS